jgi:hypothetical protein
MDFKKAELYRLTFGEHKGEMLCEVGETIEGLKYLDWMLGLDLLKETQDALTTYLHKPHIKLKLEEALENDDD